MVRAVYAGDADQTSYTTVAGETVAVSGASLNPDRDDPRRYLQLGIVAFVAIILLWGYR